MNLIFYFLDCNLNFSCGISGPYLEKNDWGGGGGRTRIAWPKATARGRVREGDVPPPARSTKLKLPPFHKVSGKLLGPLQHYKST